MIQMLHAIEFSNVNKISKDSTIKYIKEKITDVNNLRLLLTKLKKTLDITFNRYTMLNPIFIKKIHSLHLKYL
jgi:hypothetical protein